MKYEKSRVRRLEAAGFEMVWLACSARLRNYLAVLYLAIMLLCFVRILWLQDYPYAISVPSAECREVT